MNSSYPTSKNASTGNLRLLDEGNPMTFITEQASGKVNEEVIIVIIIQAIEPHQHIPFDTGSKQMVIKPEEFMAKYY